MGPRLGTSVGRYTGPQCAAASDSYSAHTLASFGAEKFAALRQCRGWRGALLGTAAAGALALLAQTAQAGPDLCTVGGTTATCQGNQSAGIASGADFDPATIDTLNVNALTSHVAPASGVPGIYFHRAGAGDTITIASDTRPFSISTTGAAAAIDAIADGGVTINHTDDLTSAAGRGIYAFAYNGAVATTTRGNVAAELDGIHALGFTGVTIAHTGDITSANGRGIYASAGNGPIGITTIGTIVTAGNGIEATNCGCSGDITIAHTGDITSTGDRAVFAISLSGSVSVTTRGNLTAFGDAIDARGVYGTTVVHTGDIASQTGRGIYANAPYGTASVTSTGTIMSAGPGIDARGYFGATIVHTGSIASTAADGIFAYSYGNITVISNGRINAAQSGIRAVSYYGNVAISHTGDITAGDAGIRVESCSCVSIISVTVAGGTVRGNNYGVSIVGGYDSTITVRSNAALTGGLAAIYSSSIYTTVNNHGTVAGNVLLTGAVNAFNNMPGALFASGTTVDIGAANLLTNDGTLAPGGIGAVLTTTLTGNLMQNAGGLFAVDVDLAGATADRLTVNGTATLGGVVAPRLVSFGATPATFTILSATGGTTNAGLTVQDSAVVDYELVFPNANDVQLQIVSVNFAPTGLTPNQDATAQNLQNAFVTGPGSLNALLGFLANLDPEAYKNALDHLHPEPYLAQVQTVLWSGLSFGNALLSCPMPVDSGLALAKEGSCLWLRAEGHTASVSARFGHIGFDRQAGGISAGFQREVWRDWHLSAAFGYERAHIDVDTRSKADGNVFHGGLALKYIQGNFLAAASLSGGFTRYETQRFDVPPAAATASATADLGTFNARLRVAYTIGSPALQAKPMIDFDVTGLFRGAIDESGAGAQNLHVRSQTDWVVSVAPALELAAQWQDGQTVWRPFVRAGLRVFGKSELTATAGFAGAPAGASPFTVTTPLDQVLAEVSAGADVWRAGRYSLRLSYDGRFGAHTSQNGGQLKLRATF